MSRSLFLLLCISLCVTVHAQDTSGYQQFNTAGWPTMVMLFGPLLLIYTLATGLIQNGVGHILQHKMLLLLHILLLFCAIMLSFGPGGDLSSPHINILGLQLWFLVLIAVQIILGGNDYVKWAYFVIGVFTLLGLTGSLALLGYAAPVHGVIQSQCLTYFGQSDNPNYNRCDDKGFLQLVRTCGTASIFILFATLSQLFLELTSTSAATAQSSYSAGKQEAPANDDPHQPFMHDQAAGQGSYQTTGDE